MKVTVSIAALAALAFVAFLLVRDGDGSEGSVQASGAGPLDAPQERPATRLRPAAPAGSRGRRAPSARTPAARARDVDWVGGGGTQLAFLGHGEAEAPRGRAGRDGRLQRSEGNVLTLRQSLSDKTIRKINKPHPKDAASAEDVWARRNEMLFEHLAVSWEVAGLPLDDQKMLVGRYRMADPEEQRWVRETIATHVERHIPELT